MATGARGGGCVTGQRIWTPDDVRALGVRTTVPIAGEIIAGLCKDESYRAVQRGTFPVPVVKCGRRMVVPVASILELLAIKPNGNAAGPVPPSSAAEDTDAA
jgi:hypothetical protein